jgi:hypothetical protein
MPLDALQRWFDQAGLNSSQNPPNVISTITGEVQPLRLPPIIVITNEATQIRLQSITINIESEQFPIPRWPKEDFLVIFSGLVKVTSTATTTTIAQGIIITITITIIAIVVQAFWPPSLPVPITMAIIDFQILPHLDAS